MLSFKREASTENYGPRVYLLSYDFQVYKIENTKYHATIYLPLFCFALLLIFYIYHYHISSLQVTVKGLATPFIALGASICLFV